MSSRPRVKSKPIAAAAALPNASCAAAGYSRWRISTGALRPDCIDRKSTRLNSSHSQTSYAVFCLKKKKKVVSECAGRRERRDTLRSVPIGYACGERDDLDPAGHNGVLAEHRPEHLAASTLGVGSRASEPTALYTTPATLAPAAPHAPRNHRPNYSADVRAISPRTVDQPPRFLPTLSALPECFFFF